MKLAVQKTLDELGVRQVAEAAGIPFWTMRKWRDADKIPGKGLQHVWRVNAFMTAVEKVKAEKAAQQAAA